MNDNLVIICRGLPGSGKSTMSNNLLWDFKKQGIVQIGLYSTDDYFVGEDGVYRFDGRKLHAAHEWNFIRFKRAIDADYEVVIADNTHVQFWECLNYAEYALKNHYTVQFKEPETPWKFDIDELLKRNTHNVPREAIQKMIERWDSTEDVLKSFEEKLDGNAVIDLSNNTIRRTVKEW